MGLCFSSTKVVSGSNGNTTNNDNRKRNSSTSTETVTGTSTKAGAASVQKHLVPSSGQRRRGPDEGQKKGNPSQQTKPKDKVSSRHVPCGKRTDFGYEKDFDKRFTLGKLLGHGQFGYTYVGIDKSNGDRVAVKRLEKAKVLLLFMLFDFVILFCLVNGLGFRKNL